MESNNLRIFIAVAQERSITKAAQKLGYVQSNVTARIKQLETELKTQLFYRHHGMILTPSGEELLPRAIQILNQIDEAQKAISESIEPTGRLSIGVNYTASSLHLPKILSRYHNEYPSVDLSLITSHADDLIYKVLNFQLDGVFVKSQSLSKGNIVKELVLEENLVLISSPKYSDVQTVCSKPFLMNIQGCPNRTQLEEWFKFENIYGVRYMEFNNLDSIIEGVMEDLGASFVPQSSIREYEEKGLLKSFLVPPKYSSAYSFLYILILWQI